VPAVLYRRRLSGRQVVVAALLQSTSLPFLVTASMIGTDLGLISSVNAAALVGAGVVSVLVFPTVALGLLREPGDGPADRVPTAARGTSVPPM
jgi:hypothetical protein